MRRRRLRWGSLLVLASAAALSGCYYYDPYTGYWNPYPPPAPYPYGAAPPYAGGSPPPEAPPGPNGPVQQTPLPPP